MKVSLAQIQSTKAKVDQNILKHIQCIEEAYHRGSDLILFPELSISGYEPELAQELAINSDDPRLNVFQELSDKYQMAILISFPLKNTFKPNIALKVYLPNSEPLLYQKMFLHQDELPFFQAGVKPLSFEYKSFKITLAICYESLLEQHNNFAIKSGSDLYLASVDKPKNGMQRALVHYPKLAKEAMMNVCVANSIGSSDNFISYGSSSAWDKNGELIQGLNHSEEGLLNINLHN